MAIAQWCYMFWLASSKTKQASHCEIGLFPLEQVQTKSREIVNPCLTWLSAGVFFLYNFWSSQSGNHLDKKISQNSLKITYESQGKKEEKILLYSWLLPIGTSHKNSMIWIFPCKSTKFGPFFSWKIHLDRQKS